MLPVILRKAISALFGGNELKSSFSEIDPWRTAVHKCRPCSGVGWIVIVVAASFIPVIWSTEDPLPDQEQSLWGAEAPAEPVSSVVYGERLADEIL